MLEEAGLCLYVVDRQCRDNSSVHSKFGMCKNSVVVTQTTSLQSSMNTKLSPHRFWPSHENELIKTIQTIPTNQPTCECQVGFTLLWIRINQDNP